MQRYINQCILRACPYTHVRHTSLIYTTYYTPINAICCTLYRICSKSTCATGMVKVVASGDVVSLATRAVAGCGRGTGRQDNACACTTQPAIRKNYQHSWDRHEHSGDHYITQLGRSGGNRGRQGDDARSIDLAALTRVTQHIITQSDKRLLLVRWYNIRRWKRLCARQWHEQPTVQGW